MKHESHTFASDLSVQPISSALTGKKIDVIVSGSIGAVESVRLIRALRRLGAFTRVWLTDGGAQFVTQLSLEWASGAEVRTDFSGLYSHLAEGDACVVAPASSQWIVDFSRGATKSPSLALAASYLGSKRALMLVPNMHASLFEAPALQKCLSIINEWENISIISPRQEESKLKFPEPEWLANEISHITNAHCTPDLVATHQILVALGGTRAPLDSVRYLGNYSSGALGSFICEELYAHGYKVHALVVGNPKKTPRNYSHVTHVTTHEELKTASMNLLNDTCDSVVFLAAVLDYIPQESPYEGKIRSGASELVVNLRPSSKIIADLHPRTRVKIGFKLEDNVSQSEAENLAHKYVQRYQLSGMVVNALHDVDEAKHHAWIFSNHVADKKLGVKLAHSKREVAQEISRVVMEQLKS